MSEVRFIFLICFSLPLCALCTRNYKAIICNIPSSDKVNLSVLCPFCWAREGRGSGHNALDALAKRETLTFAVLLLSSLSFLSRLIRWAFLPFLLLVSWHHWKVFRRTKGGGKKFSPSAGRRNVPRIPRRLKIFKEANETWWQAQGRGNDFNCRRGRFDKVVNS